MHSTAVGCPALPEEGGSALYLTDHHTEMAVEYVNFKEWRSLFSAINEIPLAGEKKGTYVYSHPNQEQRFVVDDGKLGLAIERRGEQAQPSM